MSIPKYASRVGRIPQVFAVLQVHPDGMRLTELADRFEVSPEQLREDLLAFYTAEHPLLGLSRPSPLLFRGTDGQEMDPHEATVVQLVDERPTEDLGVENLSASELGLLWSAARAMAEVEPDNQDLTEAIEVLTETMFAVPGESGADAVRGSAPVSAWATASRADDLAVLRRAVEEHRTVRIEYSRAWLAGTQQRVIAPYLLVQTRRGWEVDAAAVEQQMGMRTFLLANIRSVELLSDTFEVPRDLDRQLREQRRTTRVRIRIPHDARWAADMYAERVLEVHDPYDPTGDEENVVLDLEMLPPLDRRLGMVLLAAGLDAAVLSPAGMVRTGPDLAAELLAHHRQDG